jgi:hypothetical protein
MAHFNPHLPKTAANRADFGPVAICFQDENINYLFSRLLQAHGAKAFVLHDLRNARGDTRIVTEPQYFPMLNKEFWNKCLVVGDPEALDGLPSLPLSGPLCLSRPLTEDKIIGAIRALLES